VRGEGYQKKNSARLNESHFQENYVRKLLLTGTSDSLRGKFWQMVLKGIRHGVIYSFV
jgi:hypothetical protein